VWQLLAENTKEQDHPINCFSWGNNKSLLNGKDMSTESGELWKDLKQFFHEFYAPERMTLSVQVKTDDNME
jgi:secreted Zn-dependent insulinase-like peptidase